MVQVNQFFQPPNYLPGRISSKTSRKVVQKNCEVMSTFNITLRLKMVVTRTKKSTVIFGKYIYLGVFGVADDESVIRFL